MNKDLLSYVGLNPTQNTHLRTINDMYKLMQDNKMTIPLYQRDVSWTLKQSIALLNYQLSGKAPVSPISINSISNKKACVQQVTFLDREELDQSRIENNHFSVVDGQQRLTTNFKMLSNHGDFKTIVFDFGRARFLKNDEKLAPKQIPVGILFNADIKVLESFQRKNNFFEKSDVINMIYAMRNKIFSYNYTLNIANDLTEDEQIEWFEILNNAGTTVSAIQIRLSQAKLKGVDFYSEYMRKYAEILDNEGYDFFKPIKTTVSYPIAALNPSYVLIKKPKNTNNYATIPSDTKEKLIIEMSATDIRKSFKITLTALEKSLKFIKENNLAKPERIDYVNYLVAFFVFLDKEDVEKYKNDLIKWYKKVDFNNKSNTARRKIYADLISQLAA